MTGLFFVLAVSLLAVVLILTGIGVYLFKKSRTPEKRDEARMFMGRGEE